MSPPTTRFGRWSSPPTVRTTSRWGWTSRSSPPLGKPSIATLFGYCLGGGLELPLACTFRLAATDDAKIGLPEVDLGAVPAWGGSVRLTRTVGPTRALDMMLRKRMIGGPEALDIGLVSEIHPVRELKARARELANELASGPHIAMAGIMDAVQSAIDDDLDEPSWRSAIPYSNEDQFRLAGLRRTRPARAPVRSSSRRMSVPLHTVDW
jgi:enoyl-CoA hydratase/carnithine racemase